MIVEFVKLIGWSFLIVVIAKYILVTLLRKLAKSLQLGPKAVGNIAGIATSVPELLTVSFSALGGLLGTSLYNIMSSNIINLVQYTVSIFLQQNGKYLKNKALKIDLVMVGVSILIPIILIIWNQEIGLGIVPVLCILFAVGYFVNDNAHKLYLPPEVEMEDTKEKAKQNGVAVLVYSILLILTGTALFIVGEALNTSLERLAIHFSIPEFILGILLGFVTSLPELITFFEAQKHHAEHTEHGVVEATNNLLTSNLLNLCIIQAIGILIYSMVK